MYTNMPCLLLLLPLLLFCLQDVEGSPSCRLLTFWEYLQQCK
jgi:hypothetical protein